MFNNVARGRMMKKSLSGRSGSPIHFASPPIDGVMSTSLPNNDAEVPETPGVQRYTAAERFPARPIPRESVDWASRGTKRPSSTGRYSLVGNVLSAKTAARREKKARTDEAMEDIITEVREKTDILATRPELGNHKPDWWYRGALQMATAKGKARAPNRWNAFTHDAVEKLNAGKQTIYQTADTYSSRSIYVGLLPGDKPNITHYVAGLRKQWAEMTEAEKAEATQDSMEDLQEVRKERKFSARNRPLNELRDVSANTKGIEDAVSGQHHHICVSANSNP